VSRTTRFLIKPLQTTAYMFIPYLKLLKSHLYWSRKALCPGTPHCTRTMGHGHPVEKQKLPDTESDTRKPAHRRFSGEVTAGQWESRWLGCLIASAALPWARDPLRLTCN